MDPDNVLNAKVVLLGPSSVGKTSIVNRFDQNHFEENIGNTIGVSFISKEIQVNGITIKFQIWDTAGQERFKSVTQSYLRDSAGVLCVFDVTNPKTIEEAVDYAKDASENLGQSCVICLIGNKMDLQINEGDININSICQENNYQILYCSAKTGENISEIFTTLGKLILEKHIGSHSVKKSNLHKTETSGNTCC